MFQLKLTTKDDYPELADWWKWHRFPSPSIELLDNLRFGLMVSLNNKNICAGFVYFTNAKAFGLTEYIVSTYKVKDKALRKDAIEFLITSLIELAKTKGVKVLYSSLKNESLVEHYKNCGFILGSTNTNEMICQI